jgi:hypothetical protein
MTENEDLAEFFRTAPKETLNVAPGVFFDLCDALDAASSKPSPALILAMEKVRSGASLTTMEAYRLSGRPSGENR